MNQSRRLKSGSLISIQSYVLVFAIVGGLLSLLPRAAASPSCESVFNGQSVNSNRDAVRSVVLELDGKTPASRWETNWNARIVALLRQEQALLPGFQLRIQHSESQAPVPAIALDLDWGRLIVLNLATGRIETLREAGGTLADGDVLVSKIEFLAGGVSGQRLGFSRHVLPDQQRHDLKDFQGRLTRFLDHHPDAEAFIKIKRHLPRSRASDPRRDAPVFVVGRLRVARAKDTGWRIEILESGSTRRHLVDPSYLDAIQIDFPSEPSQLSPDLRRINRLSLSDHAPALRWIDTRRSARMALANDLILQKDVFDSREFYDFLETNPRDAKKLIRNWYPNSAWLTPDKTQVPVKHWVIVADPGVASRYELFLKFYERESSNLKDLSAHRVRQLFAQSLGTTEVVRSLTLSKQQQETLRERGLIAPFFEFSTTPLETLTGFLDSHGSSYRGPIQDIENRLKGGEPSICTSVSALPAKTLSQSIARSFSRQSTEIQSDPSSLYTLTLRVPEISLIRSSSRLLRGELDPRYYSAYIESADGVHVSLANDEVEMFLYGWVSPAAIRVESAESQNLIEYRFPPDKVR